MELAAALRAGPQPWRAHPCCFRSFASDNALSLVQVSEEEVRAGLLGPEWPAPEVLLAMQRQCVDLSHAAVAREHSPRAKRLISSLFTALCSISCLLERMHFYPSRHQSGEKVAADQAVDRLQQAARTTRY